MSSLRQSRYDAYDAWTGNHRYVRARDALIQTTRHMRHRGFQPHIERNKVIALAVPGRDLMTGRGRPKGTPKTGGRKKGSKNKRGSSGNGVGDFRDWIGR
jgi:hypothetical protein